MQVRSIVFTWNNYPMEYESLLSNAFQDEVRYLIAAREIGINGNFHLQGMIQFNKKRTLSKIGGMFPWHVEPMKGTPTQADAYCRKEDKEPFTLGALSDSGAGASCEKERWSRIVGLAQQGKRDVLVEEFPAEYVRCLQNLQRIEIQATRPLGKERKAFWLYGKSGTGKTRFIESLNENNNVYWKNANKWFDGYRDAEHNIVAIDDFDDSHKCLGHFLKRWGDRYPVLCEIKGGCVGGNWDYFFVSSNFSIREIWNDEKTKEPLLRRFKEIEVIGFETSPEGELSLKVHEENFFAPLVILSKKDFIN